MPWVLILLAVVARFLPHPFNLTPLGGLGLFAGAHLSPRVAWLVPLLALFIGDLVTGFYSPVVAVAVYAGMLGGPLAGRLLARRVSPGRFAGAVGAGAGFFYLVSNVGMWWDSYPHTLVGLLRCYVDGLPFLGRTVLADAVYGGILFGAFALAGRWRGISSRPGMPS